MFEILDRLVPVVIGSLLIAFHVFLKREKEKQWAGVLLALILFFYWSMIEFLAYISALTGIKMQENEENALFMFLLSAYLWICLAVKLKGLLLAIKHKKNLNENQEEIH